MLASIITRNLGYELIGEDYDIYQIRYATEATENDIAVVQNKSDLDKTEAKVVLIENGLYASDKSFIFASDSIECAMVKICRFLISEGMLPDYSAAVQYKTFGPGYYMGYNCCIGRETRIQPTAMIGNNVSIGAGCFIDAGVIIGSDTVIGDNVSIGAGTKIGSDSFYHYYHEGQLHQFCGCGRVIINRGTTIGYNTVIQRGTIADTIIDEHCVIGNLIDIGHDVKIGKSCKVVSQTGIAGGAVLKDNVTVYGQVGISNNVTVGNNVVIKGKTTVTRSVSDNETVFGQFGRSFEEELKL